MHAVFVPLINTTPFEAQQSHFSTISARTLVVLTSCSDAYLAIFMTMMTELQLDKVQSTNLGANRSLYTLCMHMGEITTFQTITDRLVGCYRAGACMVTYMHG